MLTRVDKTKYHCKPPFKPGCERVLDMDPERACDIFLQCQAANKVSNAAGYQDAPLVLATTSSDVKRACVRQSKLKNRSLPTSTVEGEVLHTEVGEVSLHGASRVNDHMDLNYEVHAMLHSSARTTMAARTLQHSNPQTATKALMSPSPKA